MPLKIQLASTTIFNKKPTGEVTIKNKNTRKMLQHSKKIARVE
jgi:hypothetical protein